MLRLTREQSRRVDRIAVEHFAIPSIVLMENAARGIFDVASAMLGSARGRRVVCLCGAGNNGGDGLAVARHLHNHGADVLIALAADPGRYAGDALIQWTITRRIGIAAQPATPELLAEETDLIIDAIFGTGLTSAPREPFPQLVAALDASRHRVLAVDLPSGMDADTGLPSAPASAPPPRSPWWPRKPPSPTPTPDPTPAPSPSPTSAAPRPPC